MGVSGRFLALRPFWRASHIARWCTWLQPAGASRGVGDLVAILTSRGGIEIAPRSPTPREAALSRKRNVADAHGCLFAVFTRMHHILLRDVTSFVLINLRLTKTNRIWGSLRSSNHCAIVRNPSEMTEGAPATQNSVPLRCDQDLRPIDCNRVPHHTSSPVGHRVANPLAWTLCPNLPRQHTL